MKVKEDDASCYFWICELVCLASLIGQCFQGSSAWQQVSGSKYFGLFVVNIPLYGYSTSCLPISLMIDIWVVSTFRQS